MEKSNTSPLKTWRLTQTWRDCLSIVMIHTLKHLRETAGLKSFDGQKIKCPSKIPVIDHGHHGHYHPHHRLTGGGPLIYFHHGSFSPLAMAGGIVMIVLSMLSVIVVFWVLMRYRRKLSRECKRQTLAQEDSLSKMEKGSGYEFETFEHLLKEGLKKQRRGSQGYPECGIVNTDDSDVVEEVDYLKEKMMKQRRGSQGYPENVKSDESLLTEDDGMNRTIEEKGSTDKGTGNESDTVEHMLMTGLMKQRRGSQGYPVQVKSDDSLLSEEDYLEESLKIQRSMSRGYDLGAESNTDRGMCYGGDRLELK